MWSRILSVAVGLAGLAALGACAYPDTYTFNGYDHPPARWSYSHSTWGPERWDSSPYDHQARYYHRYDE